MTKQTNGFEKESAERYIKKNCEKFQFEIHWKWGWCREMEQSMEEEIMKLEKKRNLQNEGMGWVLVNKNCNYQNILFNKVDFKTKGGTFSFFQLKKWKISYEFIEIFLVYKGIEFQSIPIIIFHQINKLYL